MENESKAQVEFRGRLVAHDYPERHAEAQRVTFYDDFANGIPHDRIRYGGPKDRYPNGITYSTREERIAYRVEERERMLAGLTDTDTEGRAWVDKIFPHKDDPNDLIEPVEEFRTDHRCPDCDVDVGEFHLPGCDIEVCPGCGGQSISCGCADDEKTDEETDEETGRFYDRLRQFWWGLRQLWGRVRYGRPRKIVIYAREHGSDSNEEGTLDRPYRTLQRAMRAVPSVIPPNRQFTVDITGIGVEHLPHGFSLTQHIADDPDPPKSP
jgi:hypothetical protein